MLNKVFCMKIDDLWGSWLTMLAKESKRGKAELIRDLIYFLTISSAGQEFIDLMTQSEVHYGD